MTTDPLTDYSSDAETSFEELGSSEAGRTHGLGPWHLAWRRLRRNRTALAFGVLFLALIAVALLAPVYADHVANTTQNRQRIADTLNIGGKEVQVVSFDGVPTGPTWHSQYFLGADGNGRDVMVRLLYGGRNSLFIGIFATLITTFLAVVFGTLAGLLPRRHRRRVSPRAGRPLGVPGAPARRRPRRRRSPSAACTSGPITMQSNSLWIPTLIIGVVYIVYLARAGPRPGPRRCGRASSSRPRAPQGAGALRIMFSELLPNLITTILVFFRDPAGQRGPARGGPVVPRRRRPAAEPVLGAR